MRRHPWYSCLATFMANLMTEFKDSTTWQAVLHIISSATLQSVRDTKRSTSKPVRETSPSSSQISGAGQEDLWRRITALFKRSIVEVFVRLRSWFYSLGYLIKACPWSYSSSVPSFLSFRFLSYLNHAFHSFILSFNWCFCCAIRYFR